MLLYIDHLVVWQVKEIYVRLGAWRGQRVEKHEALFGIHQLLLDVAVAVTGELVVIVDILYLDRLLISQLFLSFVLTRLHL